VIEETFWHRLECKGYAFGQENVSRMSSEPADTVRNFIREGLGFGGHCADPAGETKCAT
jgi:hypothetical protein